MRGEIRTRWERLGDEIVLSVTLPPGATGVARLGGREVPLASGISVLRVLAALV